MQGIIHGTKYFQLFDKWKRLLCSLHFQLIFISGFLKTLTSPKTYYGVDVFMIYNFVSSEDCAHSLLSSFHWIYLIIVLIKKSEILRSINVTDFEIKVVLPPSTDEKAYFMKSRLLKTTILLWYSTHFTYTLIDYCALNLHLYFLIVQKANSIPKS